PKANSRKFDPMSGLAPKNSPTSLMDISFAIHISKDNTSESLTSILFHVRTIPCCLLGQLRLSLQRLASPRDSFFGGNHLNATAFDLSNAPFDFSGPRLFDLSVFV